MGKTTRFLAAAAAVAAVAATLSAPAQAGTSFHVQIAPAQSYGYGNQWGYPTYQQPYQVYQPYGTWVQTEYGYNYGQRRHRGRDLDRDGIPDRYDRDLDNDGRPNSRDRDRDGDGVPNRYDRWPDNRYRY